ncbi:MAG: hypothetical protein GWO16_13475 [Gammaproteobacteria bacterium]|nr:hypothetical protein [Gammaproteobacteria bacterium]NIR31779.1 hypothetical protein [Gammaproteobacteria bacterium]NIR98710.1 hypothetical protein [Gammaproteobacteria bacterium]NIT64427.1 hypothetical protein [Gammaproteobacteria bacterium]NIV20842.1 hypothetical protein [Gammaproteobacteria bacterium]
MDEQQALSRADRIHAFAEELAEPEREGVLDLLADVRARLDVHHAGLPRRLTAE